MTLARNVTLRLAGSPPVAENTTHNDLSNQLALNQGLAYALRFPGRPSQLVLVSISEEPSSDIMETSVRVGSRVGAKTR